MSYGSETIAETLLDALTDGVVFDVPTVDLSSAKFTLPDAVTAAFATVQTKLVNDSLTTGTVGGTGTFDVIMAGFAAHLKAEFQANRISGAEYTKAYTALAEAAIGGAVQFLLGRDQAHWQAQQSQIAAVTAMVGLETAKVQLASTQMQAQTIKANYALTVLKLATEDAQFGSAKYQLDNLLPAQYQLVREQLEGQRAQTLNTRSDGSVITGSLGKQRELYDQQITSYKRDAEVKAAKMFIDTWITQKTIDEGLVPPAGLNNASLQTILDVLKTNNNFV